VAALLGWLLLHEAMSWRRAAAIALILAGVGLLTTDVAHVSVRAAAPDSTRSAD
jgi:drug/metabolite transporter (DMT)-like permease